MTTESRNIPTDLPWQTARNLITRLLDELIVKRYADRLHSQGYAAEVPSNNEWLIAIQTPQFCIRDVTSETGFDAALNHIAKEIDAMLSWEGIRGCELAGVGVRNILHRIENPDGDYVFARVVARKVKQ